MSKMCLCYSFPVARIAIWWNHNKWKHFLHHWPFGWWIYWSPMDSPHRGSAIQCVHVLFVVRMKKLLNKQWCHCNEMFSVGRINEMETRVVNWIMSKWAIYPCGFTKCYLNQVLVLHLVIHYYVYVKMMTLFQINYIAHYSILSTNIVRSFQ